MLILKRACPNLAYKWCSTKLEVVHLAWTDSLKYKCALSSTKLPYYCRRINLNKNNPKSLSVSKLTQKQLSPPLSPVLSADDFIECFNSYSIIFTSNIDTIRDEIDGLLSTQCLDLS